MKSSLLIRKVNDHKKFYNIDNSCFTDDDERQQRQKKMRENRMQRKQLSEGDTDKSNASWNGVSTSSHTNAQSHDDVQLQGLVCPAEHMLALNSPQSAEQSSSSVYTIQGPQSASLHLPYHHSDSATDVSSWSVELNTETDFSDAAHFANIHSPPSAGTSDSVSTASFPVHGIFVGSSGSQLSTTSPQASTASSYMPQPPAEFHHVPRDQLPSDPYMYWRLSEEERCLLTKLSTAYQDTVLSILQSNPPKDYIIPESLSKDCYLQECEAQTRNAIRFVKQMEDFQQLNIDNQIALLKASTGQVIGLRNSALYIAEKDAWLTSFGYMTSENAARIFPDSPHFQKGKHFCKAVKAIVKNDITMYALLHCLILFDPSDDRVLDRQLVNSIRDKYVILLRHYLESLYSYRYSDKYLMALQANLAFYREVAQDKRHLVKKLFPGISNQLLLEVYDLN